uniref:Uncharacterized protein n=1 Tax=Kalanchoe fedtschenkoi TaxID=63787 RepID=A0A7N0U0L3_KALFE
MEAGRVWGERRARAEHATLAAHAGLVARVTRERRTQGSSRGGKAASLHLLQGDKGIPIPHATINSRILQLNTSSGTTDSPDVIKQELINFFKTLLATEKPPSKINLEVDGTKNNQTSCRGCCKHVYLHYMEGKECKSV